MDQRRDALRAWFLYFILYAVFGWLYEVFLEVVVYGWGFTNRGVLWGPWCPVYGVGAFAFLLCFRRLALCRNPVWLRRSRVFLIFLGSMAVATAIELATSYLLEAVTGSWPWQTYENYSMNFQGRVALSPSIRFGLGGVLFLFVLQPLFENLVSILPPRLRRMLFWLTAILFFTDCALTLLRLAL